MGQEINDRMVLFQSTSPVRGTTFKEYDTVLVPLISIHVPREGDDTCTGRNGAAPGSFQSTSPVRGTTRR